MSFSRENGDKGRGGVEGVAEGEGHVFARRTSTRSAAGPRIGGVFVQAGSRKKRRRVYLLVRDSMTIECQLQHVVSEQFGPPSAMTLDSLFSVFRKVSEHSFREDQPPREER